MRTCRIYCLAAAKSLQSSPTLCDPIDSSPPGSPVSGILQARTLEWVAISFSNAWKWKVKVKSLSRVRLLVTPWTAAHQAPPSMGFSRQEYWSGVPLPSPKIYCLNILQIYSTVLLSIAAMLNITSPWLTYFIIGVCAFWPLYSSYCPLAATSLFSVSMILRFLGGRGMVF